MSRVKFIPHLVNHFPTTRLDRLFMRAYLISALTISVVLIMAAQACAQFGTPSSSSRQESNSGSSDRGSGGRETFNQWRSADRNPWRRDWGGRDWMHQSREVDTGYLFINAEYVEPPYRLEVLEQQLVVNGTETGISVDNLAPPESGDKRSRFEFGGPTRGLQKITNGLANQGVVVVRDDAPAMIEVSGATDLIRGFANIDERQALLAQQEWEFLSEKEHAADWQEFLSSLSPSPAVVERATEQVTWMDRIARENEASARAVQRLDQWNYPLSILGMVLVVAAFGHLLQSAPRPGDTHLYPTNRAVYFSVALVLALSALDFIWTILNSQAGHMRELNPIARGMMDQPLTLLAFKVTITLAAVGIIVLLKKYRPAQIGAWWACLICTLLTVRWLVLDSLTV